MRGAAVRLDPRTLRGDFPIFSRRIGDKPLVFLDSAATSQKPRSVIGALRHFHERHNANVHRGVYALAQEAEALVEGSRRKVAEFINAPKPETVVFTRNATESINLVAYSWARRNLKPGDEIVLTELEHHSNMVPWQQAALAAGATLRYILMEGDGTVSLEAAGQAIGPRTRLLAVTGMSNALGTLLPVKELVAMAHARGALALVDGAQLVPHAGADVRDLDCDFLAFSAHKMLGPTGIGVLYGKEEVLERMEPFLFGGDMIGEVTYKGSTWNRLPYKFEAGTPNIAGAAAFGKAVEYLEAAGMEAVREHEEFLTRLAWHALRREGVTLYGPDDMSMRGGIVSFNVGGIHPHDVGQVLDMEGVAVRVGHHCCQPLMKRLGAAGTVRASFYLYNTERDVEALIRGVRRVKDFFKVKAAVEA